MGDATEDDVYVDVEFDDGLLFLVVCNDGTRPARQVRVTFADPLLGADGVDLTSLGIFGRLDFLAPGKRIPVFLDHAHAYYARRRRSRIAMKIQWRAGNKRFSSSVTHDMRAYADLPHVVRHPDDRRVGHVRR